MPRWSLRTISLLCIKAWIRWAITDEGPLGTLGCSHKKYFSESWKSKLFRKAGCICLFSLLLKAGSVCAQAAFLQSTARFNGKVPLAIRIRRVIQIKMKILLRIRPRQECGKTMRIIIIVQKIWMYVCLCVCLSQCVYGVFNRRGSNRELR